MSALLLNVSNLLKDTEEAILTWDSITPSTFASKDELLLAPGKLDR